MFDKIGWVGLGLLSAVGAAGVAIFAKLGLEHVDTVLATALRSVIMALIVVGVAGFSGELRPLFSSDSPMGAREWLWIVLAGASGAFSWLAYFGALKLGLASKVAAVDKLSVLFIALLSVMVLGETLSMKNWLGVALLSAGVYLMAR
ncbi:MAG: EamA family transporter [Ardenticatenales bacterium]|nr:EamA family transporter [Ardenticatenales bacterium]